jgi:RNase P/RNase MRP subunit p29
MAWPEIFWGKKPRPVPEAPPPFKPAPAAETPKPEGATPPKAKPPEATTAETKPLYPKPTISPTLIATPPSIKPVPVMVKPSPAMVPQPPPPAPVETGTRTLPAMHGVILRSPSRQASTMSPPGPGQATPAGSAPPAPIKNVEQLMAEADPVRTLSQTGSVRMLKRLTPEPTPAKGPTELPPVIQGSAKVQIETAGPLPIKPQPSPVSPPTSLPPSPATAAPLPPPFPAFKPAASITPPSPLRKPETLALRTVTPVTPTPQNAQAPPVTLAALSAPPPPLPVSTGTPSPQENDSPFILKPAVSLVSTPKIIPPSAPPPPPLMPFGVFRRKAKMNDLARIILPSKREEPEPPPAPVAQAPTVVPAAFPIPVVKPGTAFLGPTPLIQLDELPKPSGTVPSATSLLPKPPAFRDEPKVDLEAHKPEPAFAPQAKAEPDASTKQQDIFTPQPAVDFVPSQPEPSFTALPKIEPQVDPGAHKSGSAAEPVPTVDPEAHKPAPEAAPATSHSQYSPPAVRPEKREFHLANGERVAGTVLSETPEAIYIEHGTLGVLTIPRGQIAKRLVEIILINGDRIVGDIMAETADTLYVRHASLGMLTVPRAQRSTRVVEAILKDGDRVLGEVLSETETYTVIKSATLGTVTVPHNKVTMLNRKIEQMELKALPPPAPELQDKPA